MPYGYGHHHKMRKESGLDPDQIASFLDLKGGESIIDIGGGDGFFSFAFLKYTPNVFLLDIENWSGQDFGNMNINFIQANFCTFKTERKFDVGFMANVYHDFRLDCKDKALENLKSLISKRIGILDFIPGKSFFGPPFKVEEDVVIRDLENIGFTITKRKYLPYHYYLVFDKKDE